MVDKNEVLMIIDGPGDQRVKIIASQTFTTVLAVLVVALRFWARKISKTKRGWDDWLIVPAALCAVAWYGHMWWYLSIGLGRYIGEVTYAKLQTGFIIVFSTGLLYATAIGLAKLSILVLYVRAFGPERWARMYIRFFAVITVLWMASIYIISCLQCRPINAFWDRSIKDACHVNPKQFYFATGMVDILTDIFLVALPLTLCLRLKLSRFNKVLLCGVFASGLFVTIVSMIRIKIILNLDIDSPDAANITWHHSELGMLSALDVNMAVVSACLPTLRPLISKIIPKRFVPSSMRKRDSVPPSPTVERSSRPGLPKTRSVDSQWRSLMEEKGHYFVGIDDLNDDDFDTSSRLSHSTVAVRDSYMYDNYLLKDVELSRPSAAKMENVSRTSLAPSWATTISPEIPTEEDPSLVRRRKSVYQDGDTEDEAVMKDMGL